MPSPVAPFTTVPSSVSVPDAGGCCAGRKVARVRGSSSSKQGNRKRPPIPLPRRGGPSLRSAGEAGLAPTKRTAPFREETRARQATPLQNAPGPFREPPMRCVFIAIGGWQGHGELPRRRGSSLRSAGEAGLAPTKRTAPFRERTRARQAMPLQNAPGPLREPPMGCVFIAICCLIRTS